jgi:hypothetical protein
MKGLLFRLALGGLTLFIGIALHSLGLALGHRQVGPSENAASQVNSGVNELPKDKKATAGACEDDNDVTVVGRYTNFNYAYSVLVPKGMMGGTNPPPSPQHGFGIDLMHPTTTDWIKQEGFPNAYVSVDGSYNSLEWASLDEAMQESLKFLSEDYGNSRLLTKKRIRLGGLRALRFVASYRESGEEMIEDEIVAFRKKGDDIVYSIDLRTPASRYARDKSVVTQIQNSWSTDPLPDVYPVPKVHEEPQ